MAKIAFTKLGLKKQDSIQTLSLNNQKIEVKQYLPINEKLDLIARVINEAQDSNNFVNPIKVDVLLTLEIIFTYTNLNFTEKQKGDTPKLYDLLVENNIIEQIFDLIPEDELEFLVDSTWDTIESLYTYHNSILGILENISNNYDHLNLDLNEIMSKIKDPQSLTLLKDVLTKLG